VADHLPVVVVPLHQEVVHLHLKVHLEAGAADLVVQVLLPAGHVVEQEQEVLLVEEEAIPEVEVVQVQVDVEIIPILPGLPLILINMKDLMYLQGLKHRKPLLIRQQQIQILLIPEKEVVEVVAHLIMNSIIAKKKSRFLIN
jgi:hypothetical protein